MERKPKQVLVVVNPRAGNGLARKVYSQFFKYLQSRQIQFFPYYTKGKNDVENISKLLGSKPFDVISILGGDGTVNLAINAKGAEDRFIHLIPCGRGNDLAEQLNGKQSISRHFDLLETGQPRPIDVWKCNERRFLSIFGIGFDGVVCESIEASRTMQIPNVVGYWYAILRNLLSYKEVNIQVDGNPKEVFMLSLANNARVGGGFRIAPDASLDDGLLDAVIISKASLFQRIRHLLRLKKGRHLGLSVVEFSRTASCQLTAERDIAAQVDGELMYERSYTVRFERQIQFIARDSTSSRKRQKPEE